MRPGKAPRERRGVGGRRPPPIQALKHRRVGGFKPNGYSFQTQCIIPKLRGAVYMENLSETGQNLVGPNRLKSTQKSDPFRLNFKGARRGPKWARAPQGTFFGALQPV